MTEQLPTNSFAAIALDACTSPIKIINEIRDEFSIRSMCENGA
jgi:hypothetical protein